MNRCPITYEECADQKYSVQGVMLLSRRLKQLDDFPFSAEEQRREAALRAAKMSIQGVQPKVSARVNAKENGFQIVDTGGTYILKPQNPTYSELPQNEDVTMRLAASVGIETPFHGLIYCKDGSFTYFIKRFDRKGRGDKLALEDFAQLSEKTRDTKYDSSMEKVAEICNRFCTFPMVEKAKLFQRVLFCFLTGNEDMHLKNFSLIRRDDKVMLSPAYDLVNTSIALGRPQEEIALPLGGKKRNLTRKLLVEYYGIEKLGLNPKVVDTRLSVLVKAQSDWELLVSKSFLSNSMKEKYLVLLKKRRAVIFG